MRQVMRAEQAIHPREHGCAILVDDQSVVIGVMPVTKSRRRHQALEDSKTQAAIAAHEESPDHIEQGQGDQQATNSWRVRLFEAEDQHGHAADQMRENQVQRMGARIDQPVRLLRTVVQAVESP